MREKSNSQETLKDIGEEEILNRLKKYMEKGQIDNDTALIKPPEKSLIINTDLLVEKVHFNSDYIEPEDIGWKAVTTNLSDLACSGVEDILGITIGLIIPPDTPWKWLDNVYLGINKALNNFGGKLLGGDISMGTEKVLSITAIGTQGPLSLHRSNALPGDYIVASGPHGLSRLGLAILLAEPVLRQTEINNELKLEAVKKHIRPIPPINALKQLINCKPKNLPWRAAGTDSSDGLLAAIQSICASSNCKAIINNENIPKHNQWPSGNLWEKWCLNGGEDYELIISLPPEWAKKFTRVMPSCSIIGKIEQGVPSIVWNNGKEINKKEHLEFKHF